MLLIWSVEYRDKKYSSCGSAAEHNANLVLCDFEMFIYLYNDFKIHVENTFSQKSVEALPSLQSQLFNMSPIGWHIHVFSYSNVF